MSATIHKLHPVPPIGHFLRLGHTGYRKIEDLHASGRLTIDRVARAALRLNIKDKKLLEKISRNSRKADDMRRVLEELSLTDHNLTRSRAPTKRAGRSDPESLTRGI